MWRVVCLCCCSRLTLSPAPCADRTVGWGDSVAAQKASDLSSLVVKAMTDAQLVDDATARSVRLPRLCHALRSAKSTYRSLTGVHTEWWDQFAAVFAIATICFGFVFYFCLCVP